MVSSMVEVGVKVGPAAAVSDVYEGCNRRGLNSRPLLEGLSSSLSLSSMVGTGVDLASGVTEGAGVGNNDLLGGGLPMIGESVSSGRSLNLTVALPATPEYFG